ncbi:MAG: hypothetical protein Q7J05_02030 [Paludibacter sp.]|nr:hypothetical protein [Paludibacter sp.]
MNESETRAELIDPKLKACGWGVVEGSKILRERQAQITDGKINVGGVRSKPLKADYILVYKGIKLAVVEAKSNELSVGEGVAQAKLYAEKLKLETTYSTNGKEIYCICMKTGAEGLFDNFLTPFKVKRIKTTLDDYMYTSDDQIIEGEIEAGKLYIEPDFNRIIEIKEREAKRVKIFMEEANQHEKAIVFCATQDHASAVRDLINQYKKSKHVNYCVRINNSSLIFMLIL